LSGVGASTFEETPTINTAQLTCHLPFNLPAPFVGSYRCEISHKTT
jgi:hypothetical protein